jgi:hypothetical protein
VSIFFRYPLAIPRYGAAALADGRLRRQNTEGEEAAEDRRKCRADEGKHAEANKDQKHCGENGNRSDG